MKMDAKLTEQNLAILLEKFNTILKEHGVEGQMIRFMIGDPADRDGEAKVNAALSKVFKEMDHGEVTVSRGCFICCERSRCTLCCYAAQ